MTKYMTMKKAKFLAGGITLCFLCIHIAMLFLFHHYDVQPMFYFNIFSVLFYCVAFILVNKGKMRYFVESVYLEVALHMGLATLCVGWNCGFQVTLIGINFLLFYAEYVAHTLKHDYVKALPMSAVGAVVYLVTCAINHYNMPPYPLPTEVAFHLRLGWGVIVFVITIAFLQIFMMLTSHSEAYLSQEVMHDKLTGLPNRYYMSEYLGKLMAEDDLEEHWVAIADLDDFKQINDTYGHNSGDEVLRRVAEILQTVGTNAEVCRWGGEEFLMVGSMHGGLPEVSARLERLRNSVAAQVFSCEDEIFSITITVGVAPYVDKLSVEDWIALADKRLYVGKCSGKNKIVSY